MKKFLNTYVGRYLVFGLCLFAVVIGLSFCEAQNKVQVAFSDTDISITSSKYNLRVEYTLIQSAEITEMPDRGENLDGGDDTSLRYGIWSNDTWGEYVVVAIPHATNCVVLHLNDGRTFVFNARSNDYTGEVFAELQSHLGN